MKKYLGKLIAFKLFKRKELITGLVVNYSDDWTLLKYNPVDYVIDGYILINNKKIEGFRREKEEIFTEKVVNLKGLQVNPSDDLPISDFFAMIEALKTFQLLQFETKSERIGYIGKIGSITDDSLLLNAIKPNGKKADKMSIPVKDIRLIQFDNDYVNSLQLLIN